MKTTILATIFIFSIIDIFAQNDTIVKRNGDKIAVTIKTSDPNSVSFVYPNEDVVNTENKNSIDIIIYKSGRVEKCSQKIKLEIINDEDDWEKVIITNSESDIAGLTKISEVSGNSSWGGAAKSLSDKNARKDMKRQAAKLKCPIILMTTYSSDYWGTKINGVAYK